MQLEIPHQIIHLVPLQIQTTGLFLSAVVLRITKLESYRNTLLQFQTMTPLVIDHTLDLLVQYETIQRYYTKTLTLIVFVTGSFVNMCICKYNPCMQNSGSLLSA